METIQSVFNAFRLPDLRRKIFITLAILVIYRFAAHIPLPGVDTESLRNIFRQSQLLGLFDMLSGGAMSNFSVVAMGVYPYITASIVMQLVMPMIPRLQELAKEGEAGRNRINQYTHLLSVPMAIIQAIGQASFLSTQGSPPVISNWGFTGEALLPTLATILTLTAGTMFALWLGELITEQGIGNGVSIIILGGIVAQIPQRIAQDIFTNIPGLLLFAVIEVVTVIGIVIVYQGQRQIPVQYGKRVRGMKVYGGQSTHIPLRVNSAGMIPLIFASSILILPGVIAQYFLNADNQFVAGVANGIYDMVNSQTFFYWLLYFLMVVAFTYFYADLLFQQQNISETLQRQGGFIPGIRPGARTAEYLNRVLRRITLAGALFLGTVAVLPFVASVLTSFLPAGTQVNPTQTMIITSTGLLIVVGVVIDTMRQLEAQLLMRHYQGFLK
ncbi:MAG: preprotein translocase subunit SecY [Chloroflexi bacterium]|nr:preprotein translocase subunit SecY [Chloroflexota bacterium]